MRIKLFVDVACPEGPFKAGQIVELPEHMADALVNAKYAEAFEEAAPLVGGESSIAVAEGGTPTETAEAPAAGKSNRKRRGQ